jgi:hypothetical protein
MSATVARAIRSSRLRPPRRGRIGWRGTLLGWSLLAAAGFFALNGTYQVVRKPTELFAPISGAFVKSPVSTWRSYGPLFERYSTSILSPELLAALAQLEGDGNPLARTPWRWQWSENPLELYRPASSAVGLLQITDGTFAEARRYCIRDHQVVTDGPWYDPRTCWFTRFYSRVIPSDAIEMTAAYLHQRVVETLAAQRRARVRLAQERALAAVIHLCGPGRGAAFVRRGFRATPGERCGAHSLGAYLHRVDALAGRFARLRAAQSS